MQVQLRSRENCSTAMHWECGFQTKNSKTSGSPIAAPIKRRDFGACKRDPHFRKPPDCSQTIQATKAGVEMILLYLRFTVVGQEIQQLLWDGNFSPSCELSRTRLEKHSRHNRAKASGLCFVI